MNSKVKCLKELGLIRLLDRIPLDGCLRTYDMRIVKIYTFIKAPYYVTVSSANVPERRVVFRDLDLKRVQFSDVFEGSPNDVKDAMFYNLEILNEACK